MASIESCLWMQAKGFMDSGAWAACRWLSSGDSMRLVPSELIVDLVKDRLQQQDVKDKGCLLDGFPRAPDQALRVLKVMTLCPGTGHGRCWPGGGEVLGDQGTSNLASARGPFIEVPDDTLVERGCGRRLDPETGEIYHLKFKRGRSLATGIVARPPPEEVKERLVHRSDDQESRLCGAGHLVQRHAQTRGAQTTSTQAGLEAAKT